VVVSPILPTSSSLAAGSGNRWQPVLPGTDLALAMGMIRWIIENDRYDVQALSQPGPEAMKAAGEASWTNATHLLVTTPDHPRYGYFVRGADLACPAPSDDKKPHTFVVQNADGALAPHPQAGPAELPVEREITLTNADGSTS